ncbi:Uncharacterised protein [Streptococcus pneumoniae]|nr:Uncharacterised protein [Streptococcus pneumoniae]CJN51596.1 Uncharacterised protein [Streptococcus pneumoniae]
MIHDQIEFETAHVIVFGLAILLMHQLNQHLIKVMDAIHYMCREFVVLHRAYRSGFFLVHFLILVERICFLVKSLVCGTIQFDLVMQSRVNLKQVGAFLVQKFERVGVISLQNLFWILNSPALENE